MKALLLVALSWASAQEAAEPAPSAPPTEVVEAAPDGASVAAAAPDGAADKAPRPMADAAPRPEKEPLLVAPPSPEVQEAARKTAEQVVPQAPVRVDPGDEWDFAKAAAEETDPAMQDAAAEELRLFVRRHPDAAQAPEALSLLAGLRARRKDWQAAAVALLRAVHEYPQSKSALRAKSAYLDLVDKNAARKQKAALSALASPGEGADRAARLAALWERLADAAPDALYAPAVEEVRGFLARFPSYERTDRLLAALARLHAANGEAAAAALTWRKLLALKTGADLRPAALLSLGELYAGPLKDPRRAIDAYEELVEAYPKDERALGALQASAALFEERLKQPGLAVEMHERIAKAYPKTPAALASLKAIARLQRERLNAPDEAIKTLLRLSSEHGGQEGIEALLLSATIARRDLKDYPREAELRQKVAADYPDAKEAPHALYDAAGVLEDDAKDAAKAIEAYKAMAEKYPTHRLAKKASERAEKLANPR